MENEKIYIDLSKCSEDEIKSIPHILEKAGEKATPAFNKNLCNSDIVHFHNEWRKWAISVGIPKDKKKTRLPRLYKTF